MLSPRLTNCPECANIPSLLKKIDCKLAELGNSLYNNISYMLNNPFPSSDIFQLIGYRRILMYKYCNPNYVHKYSVAIIASKVIRLTVGCISRCNTPEPCIEVPCDITIVPNPSSTTTTSTTVAPTTTTSTTVAPTTTTTSSSSTSTSTSSTTSTTTAAPITCSIYNLQTTGPSGSPGDSDWSATDCYTELPVGGTITYPDIVRLECIIDSSLVLGTKVIVNATDVCPTTTTSTTRI